MASSALEQEFVKVISDITKEVSEDVVKNNALKSIEELNNNIDKLKKEYEILLECIDKNKQIHYNELELLNKDLVRIKETYTKENKNLVKEINEARDNYKTTTSLLLKNIKKEDGILDESFKKIKYLQNNLESTIKTWNSTTENNRKSIDQLIKQVNSLESYVNKETQALKKNNEINYGKLDSIIKEIGSSVNIELRQIDDQCKSISLAMVEKYDEITAKMSEDYNDISNQTRNMERESNKKYKLLMIVNIFNIILTIIILWYLVH
ncbi:hypothetical protein [Selenomonas ruminantium]|uniref:Uncharacterized protein n=1 Tax=Selenomonas ruminantium TaxID=971 RepID=A0A1H3VQ88_SELRU|nr:hypothetical protein [Selenomonas ruminantium]SDZ76977.1 hypothetical protein SAMN05660648_00480 [Selenomonas ruminantium]